ncbi:MAG: hypothetical protein MJZ68_07985 [archaeon]|nr:hypothetical protein [archaeon]
MNTHNETRSVVISNFRNLGISDDMYSGERLVLNRTLDRNNLGGLVTILGYNNSGKTNVLDAICKINGLAFEETDNCDFNEKGKPFVYFDVAGGKYGQMEQPILTPGVHRITIEGSLKSLLLYVLKQKESYALYVEHMSEKGMDPLAPVEYMNDCLAFIRGKVSLENTAEYISYILSDRTDIQCRDLGNILYYIGRREIQSVANESTRMSVKGTVMDDIVLVGEGMGPFRKSTGVEPEYIEKDRMDEYRSKNKGIKSFVKMVVDATGLDSGSIEDYDIVEFTGGVRETEVVPDAFSERYGYNLGSNVYRYDRRIIKESDLESKISEPSFFICNLFTILGYDPGILDEKYLESSKTRENLEKEFNAELQMASEEFNSLVPMDGKRYGMNMRIDSDHIRFSLSVNGEPVKLEHQSEGFRWLFEFFLNFLRSKKFMAGDLILLDEFGGLLNFDTVRRLTEYMRTFGKRTGITFVIATQNPMAIDINHLEEVRMVMSNEDRTSSVINDFTGFGYNGDMDAVRPILSSLTVNHHFLQTGGTYTVFVRTVKEYFLLSRFAEKSGTDLDVIPLLDTENGIGDQAIESMKTIDRRPVLLVSGNDSKFREMLKEKGVETCSVSDILDGAEDLSDLLSDEDRMKMDDIDGSFDSVYSVVQRLADTASKETLENCSEFLDYLSV